MSRAQDDAIIYAANFGRATNSLQHEREKDNYVEEEDPFAFTLVCSYYEGLNRNC